VRGVEITAQYEISRWNEWTELAADYPKLARVSTGSTYTGDLAGSATGESIMTYVGEATVAYTGYERFTGSIGGRTGTAVFRVDGTFTDGTADSAVEVVTGSGTGELSGLTGTGRYVARHGEPTIDVTFSCSLP
jgi:hypothetical protein